jgi:hypothetical protein
MTLSEVKKRIGEVLQRANRFWAGEAEVAAAFFSQPRSKDEHLFWLKSQMVRELGWPDGRLTRVMDAFKQLESVSERHAVHAALINAEEEYSHYVVLADIAETIAGRRIVPDEIMYNKDLPEWQALAKVRTSQAGWDSAVSGFHEGGGLGIYYTCMNLQPIEGDPYRPAIAEAMAMIYGDELGHAAHGFRTVVQIAAQVSDEEWQQVLEKVEAVGYHRVRMRNEQFGFPLTNERIEEIKEGKILPYLPPLPDVEEIYAEIGAPPAH